MNILFHYWFQSLREVFSLALFTRFGEALIKYFHSLQIFVLHFGFLILLDSVISFYFGKNFFQILLHASGGTPEASISMLTLYMVSDITWFIISTGLFTLIRLKKHKINVIHYLKMYVLRYIQLSLVFCLIFLFFLLCMINFGITKLPIIHSSLIFFIQIIKSMIMFYWLDSHFLLKDMGKSFERGINTFVYNFPFFCFIMILMYLSDTLIKYVLLQPELADIINANFSLLKSNNSMDTLKQIDHNTISIIRFIGFKYVKFLIDYFWIAVVFIVYDHSKEIPYAHSFFDSQKRVDDNDDDEEDNY